MVILQRTKHTYVVTPHLPRSHVSVPGFMYKIGGGGGLGHGSGQGTSGGQHNQELTLKCL